MTANPTLRASVTADAQGLDPGDAAPILVDGSDTPITANGLQGYTPTPGDRILVQQVGQTMEVMQFLSVGSIPGAGTIRQDTAPSTTTTPLGTIWYDSSNSNKAYRLEVDATTGVPTWEPLVIDSGSLDIANVRANTVEKGFVLGGGGVGVLSSGATNPTAGPVVSNYYPQWLATFSGGTPNGSQDVSQFFAGMDEYLADSTKWVCASAFFGTNLRVINKSDGQLGAFPDPTNGKSWVSQFYSWGGVAQDGVDYWLLGSDNNRSVDTYLYAINGTTYNKDAELRIGNSSAFGGVSPCLVGDKVNHRVGMIWIPNSGNLMLRWYHVSGGSVTQVGSDITLKTGVGQQSVGDAWFGDAGSGLGASTLWVALEGDNTTLPNVMCWSSVTTSAATRQTTADWKRPSAKINALGFNATNGHFQVLDQFAAVRETSQIAQVPGSSTSVTARTTFYDGDTGNYAGGVGSGTVIINGTDVSGTPSTAHETGYSPTTTFTTARRAWVRITSPVHAPDETNLDSTKVDRANKIGFYTAIGGGTMWRQAYGSVGQVLVDGFDTFPSSGTPDVHTFATAQQSLGVFESAGTRLDGGPKFYVDGAGSTANLDGLIPPGTIVMYGGATVPAGWKSCDGSSLSTTSFPDLFAAIGYNFGGSGASFTLPSLNAKFARGTTGTPGSTGGQDTLPDHTHGTGTYVTSSVDLNLQTNTTTGGSANRITQQNHSHVISGNSGIVIGTNPSILPSYVSVRYLIKL